MICEFRSQEGKSSEVVFTKVTLTNSEKPFLSARWPRSIGVGYQIQMTSARSYKNIYRNELSARRN